MIALGEQQTQAAGSHLFTVEGLKAHGRAAVEAFRSRSDRAVTRPIEAARVALLSHLRNLRATNQVLDDDAATRIVVAIITAFLDEPEGAVAPRRTSLQLTLNNVQELLIEQLLNPLTDRDTAARIYAAAQQGAEPWDWERIDHALITRWGVAGLEDVQARAAARRVLRHAV